MSAIYPYLLETLKKTDTKEDLEWFANIYGTHSKLTVPEYEEYDPNTSNLPGGANTQDNNANDENTAAKRNKSGLCTTL